MSRCALTFDIDWAPDWAIESCVELCTRYDVPATFFVTHDTPVLDQIREHPGLDKLNQWSFGDTNGSLVDGLGIRDAQAGVALRATFIVDPHGTIQHVAVNGLNVGRNPKETLRILDALQSDELCPCNREIGGDTIDVSAEAGKLAAA